MTKRKNKKIIKKLRNKLRLIVYNDETYEERWSMRLNRLNIITLVAVFFVFISALTYFVLGYTSLKYYLPNYPDESLITTAFENDQKIKTIENIPDIYHQYYQNLKNILDQNVEVYVYPEDTIEENLDSASQSIMNFSISKEDSLLRAKIEHQERFSISVSDEVVQIDDISKILFYPPLKGVITNHFSPTKSHYGIDIVSANNDVISATLDGTVTLATWTIETGYVIQIQHKNNLISTYKHNAELLKKVGSTVKSGEAIAIFGNTGEYSSGPHLHFELWHNGTAIDPEKYIIF
ncbi:MAG: M23 family metallopeptidase [Bacteroidales bacterium]|nr:M23 family metallopeptidase [Bacteroidales bacterium]